MLVHRVDHLYTFFVQWSPEMYTKSNKKHREPHYIIGEKQQKHCLVVERNKAAVGKILSGPVKPPAKNWEVRSAQCNKKKKKNICGFFTIRVNISVWSKSASGPEALTVTDEKCLSVVLLLLGNPTASIYGHAFLLCALPSVVPSLAFPFCEK